MELCCFSFLHSCKDEIKFLHARVCVSLYACVCVCACAHARACCTCVQTRAAVGYMSKTGCGKGEREEKHEREKKRPRLQMLKSERAWFLPQFLVSFSKTYHHKQQNSHEREWGKSGEKNKGKQLQQTSRLCFPIRLCDSIILLDALH